MKVEDLRPHCAGWRIQLHEKDGKGLRHSLASSPATDTYIVPSLIADLGDAAGWRYVEFFTGNTTMTTTADTPSSPMAGM